MTSRQNLLISAALTAVLCAPGIADAAKKRVVVLDVEGARNQKLERSLADLVAEEARVIPSGKYRKLARKLRAAKLSPDHVAKVAARLEADGVLESLIIADAGRYVLRLRLREGTSGRTIKKIAVRLRAPELSGKIEDDLADRLLEAIAGLPALETIEEMDGDPDEDAAEVTRSARTRARRPVIEDEDQEAEPEARPKKSRARPAKARRVASAGDDFESALEISTPNGDDDEDAGADDEAEAEEDDEEPVGEVTSGPRRKAIPGDGAALAAGLRVIKRRLAFNSRSDLLDAPQGYTGSAYPAAAVAGEVYPMVLLDRPGAMANLGIGFAAHRVIGLKTQVLVDDMVVSLPTDETGYGVDVRYRHRVRGARGPLLVASLGWSRLRFAIDRTAGDVDVPNNNYRYYRPGLEIRYAASPRVTLSADGQVFLIRGTGGIEKAEEYGAAKMTGGEAGGGVEVLWGTRLVTRLGGRITLMGYEFRGAGAQTTDRDGDPTTVDVGGALDRYLVGELTAGYLF